MVGKTKINSGTKREFTLVDRERKRISGELHDNVSSKLAVIQHVLHHNTDTEQEVLDLLDHVIYTVRNISHRLYSPFLDKISFLDAVRDFVLPLNKVISVKIEYFSRQYITLPKQNRLHLFRILQEIINNILKHAKASHIVIRMHHSNNYFNLFVQDDGIGFDYNTNKTGLGMTSIQYRARKLNAKCKFKPIRNGGTLFIISVPCTNQKLDL